MDKGRIEAMVTKFSEKFAIIMLKKHRKFCRRGLTHLDATPIFKKSSGSFWDTLYVLKLLIIFILIKFLVLIQYVQNSNFAFALPLKV